MNTTCYENIDKSYFGDFKRNPAAKPLKMDTVFPFAALSNLCLDVYLETEGKNPRNDDSKEIAKEVINKTINKRDGRLLYATYHSKIDNEPYDFTIDFKVNKRTRDDDSHDREDDLSSSSTKKFKALNGQPEPVFIKQEKNTDNSENISDANSNSNSNSTVTIKTEKTDDKTDDAPKILSDNDKHDLELQDLEPWQKKAKLKEQKAKEALLKKEKRDKLKEEKDKLKEEKDKLKEEKNKLKEQRAKEALLKKELKEKEKAQKDLLKAQKAKDALLKKQLKEKEKEQKLIDKLQKAKEKEDKIKLNALKMINNNHNSITHDNNNVNDDNDIENEDNEHDISSDAESHAD
jgi:hypothetical protein